MVGMKNDTQSAVIRGAKIKLMLRKQLNGGAMERRVECKYIRWF